MRGRPSRAEVDSSVQPVRCVGQDLAAAGVGQEEVGNEIRNAQERVGFLRGRVPHRESLGMGEQ